MTQTFDFTNDVKLRERDYWCAGKAFVRNFHMIMCIFTCMRNILELIQKCKHSWPKKYTNILYETLHTSIHAFFFVVEFFFIKRKFEPAVAAAAGRCSKAGAVQNRVCGVELLRIISSNIMTKCKQMITIMACKL